MGEYPGFSRALRIWKWIEVLFFEESGCFGCSRDRELASKKIESLPLDNPADDLQAMKLSIQAEVAVNYFNLRLLTHLFQDNWYSKTEKSMKAMCLPSS